MFPVPPVALKLKLPLPPLHKASIALAVKTTALGSVMLVDVDAVHPLASVATMANVPGIEYIGLVVGLLFTMK